MDIKIETRINLIPFGNISYSAKAGFASAEPSKEIFKYQAPKTTDVGSIEFSINNEIVFVVPSTENEGIHL